MTLNNMDLYFINKGFMVIRKYNSSTKEYEFQLSKNGIKKKYYWKYDMRVEDFEQYQKESMDAMIKDFNEKAVIDNAYKMACNSLFGSIDSGYVYNPNMDIPSLYPQTRSIKDYNKAYNELNDYIDKKVRNMLEIPELNNRTLKIKDVIFNDPATIVFWNDGTKTVVKAVNEDFDREKGLAIAITKKFFGNKGNYYNNVKKWLK